MVITTHKAGMEHVAVIANFIHDLLAELSGGDGPSRDAVLADTRKVLQLDQVSAVLAVSGSVPVGLIMLNECAAIYAGGRFGEVSELYVRPEFRSQGVAARLIKVACAEGKRRDWKRLEVGAPHQPDWKRTLDFYVREGFEEVGPRLRRLI